MSSDESTSKGNTNINISKKTVKTILNVLSWLVFVFTILVTLSQLEDATVAEQTRAVCGGAFGVLIAIFLRQFAK
tara:strand:+ start:878 stop:1102 length:225 start_codon:yes stop_codon:yes gene_type:complete